MTGTARGAAALRAHVETWRPYTLWYVGLVGLAGAGQAGGHRLWPLVAAWATPTAGWLGGHYLGDYADRRLDAMAKPYRPIPSGRLAPRHALACAYACFAAVAVLAVAGGVGTSAVAVLAVAGIVGYSRWFKASGVAGNLVRGALGAAALMYGVVAARPGALDRAAVATIAALVAAFCLHDTMTNLVGALRDIDGDRAGGYATLPVRRDAPAAVWTVLGLAAGTVATAVAAGVLHGPRGRWWYLATLAVALVLGVAALRPVVTARRTMPAAVALRAHGLLVIERLLLASAAVGLGLGPAWQYGLAVPMIALTWWTQSLMRAHHELGPPARPHLVESPQRTP